MLKAKCRLNRTSDRRIAGEVILLDERGRQLLTSRWFEVYMAHEAIAAAKQLAHELVREYRWIQGVAKIAMELEQNENADQIPHL